MSKPLQLSALEQPRSPTGHLAMAVTLPRFLASPARHGDGLSQGTKTIDLIHAGEFRHLTKESMS